MNGVINVYKEPGFTSHDVVAKLRGILHMKKIGHTGTLDPQAEGVLPVCLGNATKLCDMLTDKTKEYEALLRLGITTDTQDMTGAILEEKAVCCSEDDINNIMSTFVGKSEQIPPMYSALKVNGKKLYELAREGKEVERKPRPVEIFELEILNISFPLVRFRVVCSKGTYIRTLCQDIGQKAGCGGCMEHVKRTRVERFRAQDALTLSEIEKMQQEGRLPEVLVTVEDMFDCYPPVTVANRYRKAIDNGNSISPDMILLRDADRNGKCMEETEKLQDENTGNVKTEKRVRVYNEDGVFYGIYEYVEAEHRYKPYKMFLDRERIR